MRSSNPTTKHFVHVFCVNILSHLEEIQLDFIKIAVLESLKKTCKPHDLLLELKVHVRQVSDVMAIQSGTKLTIATFLHVIWIVASGHNLIID